MAPHGSHLDPDERRQEVPATRDNRMTPDRRQFVASLAGVPMLLQSVTAAQRGGSRAGFSDPVLEQIITDLRELKAEVEADLAPRKQTDRKSTRLNSSRLVKSYAVFC